MLIVGDIPQNWQRLAQRVKIVALIIAFTSWPMASVADGAEIGVALKSRRIVADSSDYIPVLIQMSSVVDIQAELP